MQFRVSDGSGGQATVMTLQGTGNVGIGTTNPIAKLQIGSQAQSVPATYGGDLLISTADGTNGPQAVGGIEIASASSGYGAKLYTHNSADYFGIATRYGSATWTERLVIKDQTGNVGIGTTSPSYTLQVNGTAWVTSGSWSGSDQRWKKNIQPITNSLDKVLQLSGVSYNWRTDEFPANNFDSKTHLGFIAQDVEKIVPDLVTTGADGFKGIDYSGFSSLLVNAVKEQQTQVTSLAANLDSLKLKTDTNITTLLQLQTSVDENLLTINNKFATIDTQLASSASELANLQTQLASSASELADSKTITTKLQTQIDELKLQNQKYEAFDSLIANISNIDNLIFKDSLGNLDLLGGKLTASEIEAGVLTIKVVDLASPTIGTGVIKAGESSVIVSTKAVGADSKIFVTVSKSSKAVPIKTGLIIPGESFVVEMNDPLLDELEFNWWIVREKN